MGLKTSTLLPCHAFFSAGHFFTGILALFMQLSLIFWPRASAWSRRLNEREGVDQLLRKFSVDHQVPVDPYAKPAKKFRQAA